MRKLLKDPRLLLVLAPLILLSPVYLTGKALFWGTPAAQFMPWWDFAWRSITSGQFPFWNPLAGMGAPLVANYQSALFYPPTWIYLAAYLLGGLRMMAWSASLVVCGHLIWSGLGTALLLREMKASEFGQAVGGLAFSLSGYLVARAGFLSINATAAWLPWLMLYLLRLAKREPKNIVKLTAVLVMLLLAGHAQTAWMTTLMGGAWVIYWSLASGDRETRLKNLGRSAADYLTAGLLAGGIAAVQLLPTLEYLKMSQRAGEYGYQAAMTYSFWPWRFLTYLLPDLFGNPAKDLYWGYGNFWEDAVYIGLLPVLLALGFVGNSLLGKVSRKEDSRKGAHSNLAVFLGMTILVSFILALGDNTAVFPFLYRYLPGMNMFQAPTRYSLLAEISLALLAGLAASNLTRPGARKIYFLRLALAGCVSIVAGAVLAGRLIDGLRVSFINSVGQAGLVGLAAAALFLIMPGADQERKLRRWNFGVVCLISLDLIWAGWGLNPGVELGFYGRNEAVIDQGRIWMPAEIEYQLKFNRFFRFDTFSITEDWGEMKRAYLPNLPMLEGAGMVNNFDPFVPGTFQEWMDGINMAEPNPQILEMMNVGAIAKFTEEGTSALESVNYASGYVWAAGCADVVGEATLSPEMILAADEDLISNLIISSGESLPCEPTATGEIVVLEHRNGYLRLRVEMDDDGWVFWSQTWYPGWYFRIDGAEKRTAYRANYLFQAAPVAKEAAQVEFIYQPPSVIWGAALTVLSVLLGGTGAIIQIKKSQAVQGE